MNFLRSKKLIRYRIIIQRRLGLFYIILALMLFFIFCQFRDYDTNHWWNISVPTWKRHPLVSEFMKQHLPKAPIQHHHQLETHLEQMMLAYITSSSAKDRREPELYEIMERQLRSVPYGAYEGKPFKKILYWNTMNNFPLSKKNHNYGVGVGKDRYKLAGCPVWQCETSEDRTDILSYDAIIFNQHHWNSSDIPKERSPDQRYIFFSYEPPVLRRLYSPSFKSYWSTVSTTEFNWTMTYRWDSDIVHPFTYIAPNGSVPLHPTEPVFDRLLKEFNAAESPVNYAAGKTKMAAFFESNCHDIYSGRQEMIKQLRQNGIEIDHYGVCGNMTCAFHDFVLKREEEETEYCLKMAGEKYKFFISFDNSLCLDWMPERFTNAMRHSMIPIVMDVHGNHAKLAPPHSFINALDFQSAAQLADYLNLLDKNDTLYNEYFWWRPHYRIDGNIFEGLSYKYFCSLCAALHDPERTATRKSYSDIKKWWRDDAMCKKASPEGFVIKDLTVEY